MVIRRGSFAHGILVALLLPTVAAAQQSPNQGVGIVTAIQGQATVGRASLPQPTALRFKDDVFFRDEISTRERATVRLLLGGKGSLTIREQSQVTLDESVMPDGGRRSVLGLLVGKIGAAIARGLMRPGDTFEIRTPNAIASVRGTVLIAEYIPPQGRAAAAQPVLLASAAPGPILAQAPGTGGMSNFYVLSGQVTVTPQGQPPVTVGPLQTVSVTATPGGVQASAVQTMTPAQATQASQGLDTAKPHTGEPEGSKTAQAQVEVATAVANSILQATTGQSTTPTAPVEAPALSTPIDNTVAPVTPQVPPSAVTGENVLPAGPLLSLDNVHVGLAAGNSLITHNSGVPNTVAPVGMTGGGTAVVTSPLLQATGDPITHAGSYVRLTNGASIVGSSSDTTTPVMYVGGTSMTNTRGPLFDLGGGSVLTTFGPVLGLDDSATVTLAGLLNIAGGSEVALGPAAALVVPSGNRLTATAPLFNLTGGSALSTYQGGSLVSVDPATLTLNAPILTAAGSYVVLGGPVLRAVDSTVTSSQPLVLLQSGSSLLSTTGAVLDLKNTSVDLGSQPVIQLLGGSSFMTMAGPVIRINGGSLTADVLGSTDGNANTWGLTGTILDLTNTTVKLRTLGTDPQQSSDASIFSLSSEEPWIRMANSNLTLTGVGEALLDPGSRTESTVGGLGLIATSTLGNTISLAGPLLNLYGVTLTDTNPYIQLTNMTVTETGSNSFIEAVDGDLASLAGPLLSAAGSTFSTGAHLLLVNNNTQLSTTTGLISDNGSNFSVANGAFVRLADGGSLTGTSSNPLIELSGTTFTGGLGPGTDTGGAFLNMRTNTGNNAANKLTLSGPFLKAKNANFNSTDSNFINVRDNAILTSSTTSPLVDLTSSAVTAQNIIRFGPYVTNDAGTTIIGNGVAPSITLAGPLLKATDTKFTATSDNFFAIRDAVNMTLNGPTALIDLIGTTPGGTVVTARNGHFLLMASSRNQPPTLSLPGPLLSASNTTLNIGDPTANTSSFISIFDSAELKTTGGNTLLNFDNSTVNTAGDIITVRRSSSAGAPSKLTLAGQLFSATNNSSFNTTSLGYPGGSACCGGFFIGQGSQLTSSGTDPLIYMSHSTFNAGSGNGPGGSLFSVTDGGAYPGESNTLAAPSTVSLTGPVETPGAPLLYAGDSTITALYSLLNVTRSNFTSTTTQPLMQFSGSTINAGSLLSLTGVNTDSNGLGTDKPLTTGGAILEFNSSSTVNLNGAGSAVRVDTALLNASGPIVNLINSAMNANSTAPIIQLINGQVVTTNSTGVMQLSQGNVTSQGPVFGLNKSILTVQNGPLLSLTGGSQMTVNADFATLTNNSRITVVNGPLIAADGAGTKLWVTGNLLNFLTASGNQVVVTNSIAPNMYGNSVDGVTAKGNVVFPGDTPVIKNLSSNSVPSLNSSTTTMINATNGAKVCVKTGSC